MGTERASIFDADELDVSAFTAAPKKAQRPKPDKEAVRALAEKTGFPSREATPAAPVASRAAPAQRRYTTGRNRQLNIKVRDEALQRFYALVESEGQVQGEIFERAVMALERELKAGKGRGA